LNNGFLIDTNISSQMSKNKLILFGAIFLSRKKSKFVKCQLNPHKMFTSLKYCVINKTFDRCVSF